MGREKKKVRKYIEVYAPYEVIAIYGSSYDDAIMKFYKEFNSRYRDFGYQFHKIGVRDNIYLYSVE
jgi:hypothetical protein